MLIWIISAKSASVANTYQLSVSIMQLSKLGHGKKLATDINNFAMHMPLAMGQL